MLFVSGIYYLTSKVVLLSGATDLGISGSAVEDDEISELISRSNAFAKEAAKEGFSFSYHNHSKEFIRTADGRTVMERLISGFDSELVYLMPDTYWLQHGGVDVVDFIRREGKRVKILHLKDMKRDLCGPTFAECGVGNLNLVGIISEAKAKGIGCFVVEQDVSDNPIKSAKISYEYLKNLV